MVGDNFVGQENSSRGTALPRCKFGGNLLDFGLAEANAAHLDGAICVNQRECRNGGEAVLVGDGIALFIDQGGESNAVFGAEFLGVARVVLRNPPKGRVLAAVGLEEPLEKREGELADRAGDLEERGDDGPLLQRVLQRERLAVGVAEREKRRLLTGKNVGHRFNPQHTSQDPRQLHGKSLAHFGATPKSSRRKSHSLNGFDGSCAACSPSAGTGRACTAW